MIRNKKNITIFHLKNMILTAVKNHSILHRRVIEMPQNDNYFTGGTLGSDCQNATDCYDSNSICFSNKCQCGQGYNPVGLICYPLASTTPSSCTLTCTNGRVCVVDPRDGGQSCRCQQGFTGAFFFLPFTEKSPFKSDPRFPPNI